MPKLHARAIKRAPVPTKGDLAELGFVLEVEVQGHAFVWDENECPLLWHEKTKSLVWYDGRGLVKKVKQDDAILPAIDAFERFKDQDATTLRGEKWKADNRWVSFGRAARVNYFSDKWGNTDNYTHALGRRVMLYRKGSEKGPWVFVLRGGKLRCTPRGLEG
jgi:hypothetical protein